MGVRFYKNNSQRLADWLIESILTMFDKTASRTVRKDDDGERKKK